MTNQHVKIDTVSYATAQNNAGNAAMLNPRIIQLDTLLNRSRFIWHRENGQQASNNN